MATIECTFEEFKRAAKEFRDNAPTFNAEELESAWHCLGLHYLGMNEPMWQRSAAIVLQMEARTKMARETQISASGVTS